jgi:hypothetical protein
MGGAETQEEGIPPEVPLLAARQRGKLVVVASCPERGTLQPDGTGPYNQEVMTRLIELRDEGRIQVAFDRAGTSTSSPQDTQMFHVATALMKRGEKERVWMRIIESTKWFHAYKQMVKMALQQIQTANLEHYLEVVCIDGGPITRVEQRAMAPILRNAVEDCAKKGVQVSMLLVTVVVPRVACVRSCCVCLPVLMLAYSLSWHIRSSA